MVCRRLAERAYTRRRCWVSGVVCLLVCGTAPLGNGIAYGQNTWNNNGATWEVGENWSQGTLPGNTTIAQFTSGSGFGSTILNHPTISTSQNVLSLILGSTAQGTGWNLSGSGTLLVGGLTTGTIFIRGAGTSTMDGPSLAGATNRTLNISLGTGRTLVLQGNSAITANPGTLTLIGGTLLLDNRTTDLQRITGATLSMMGGTLALNGNTTTASTTNANSLVLNAGANRIAVTANGVSTGFQFANSGSFSLGTLTSGVVNFDGGSGTFGASNGPRVLFNGTPNLGANGLLANRDGGGVGFATITDAGGTHFVTYVTPTSDGGGIVAATATQTVTDANGLATLTATDRGQFDAGTTTITASGTVTTGSLRLSANGGTLEMGDNNLATNALMVDGGNYTINATTGALGVTGQNYIYVNSANATLTTGLILATSDNTAVNIAGPGFVALSGTAQNQLSGANRVNLLGGTLRANDAQIGLTNTGNGSIALRGGVLEITGGGTFTRTLSFSNVAGGVNWDSIAFGDNAGSGGFSAFGANATVNLGGANATYQWAGSGASQGFVRDGCALIFGSTKSDAVLTFANGIKLDSGTAGNYAAREMRVVDNAATRADYTVLSQAISGSSAADLLKTGDGTLRLSATNNTYAGNTLLLGGTLEVTGNIGTGTLTAPTSNGVVVVNQGTTLAGTGEIRGGTADTGAILLMAGGTLAPGLVGDTTPATLSATSLTWQSGGTLAFDLSSIANQGLTAASDQLDLGTFFNGHTTNGTWVFDFGNSGAGGNDYDLIQFSPGQTDFVASDFTYENLRDGVSGSFVLDASTGVLRFQTALLNAQMPEPYTWQFICLGFLSFGGCRSRRCFRPASAR